MHGRLFALAGLLLAAACAPPKEDPLDYKHPAPQAVGLKAAKEELDALMLDIEHGKMPRIKFDFDSDAIHLDSYPTLDTIAALMLKYPNVKVMILAHADAMGTAAYNVDLSRRRGRAVKEYLSKRGVPPTWVRYHGMSYDEPTADNSTEEGRSQNRRVEFRLSTREWEVAW
jgi:outer membrane protein OmpA-like peptidoglycan-associated protein